MNTHYRIKLSFFVLIIILVVAAYLIANTGENDWIGISLHSLSTNEAQSVIASGASWIRIDVFPEFETDIKNAKAYDLKVLAILDSWMFNQTMTFTLEEWQKNVTHYVSQYANEVDAWEIWNEPANPDYPLTADFYYKMVEIASPIIREYDPSAKIVLFGGLNLWSGGDSHLELDKNFSNKLANRNIEQYGDVISLHAYPWSNTVESTLWQKYDEALSFYSELFDLEFWVTETGHYIDYEGEIGQAQYTHDSLVYFKGKVAKYFWYSLLDNYWEPRKFGLIDGETLRLAYYELTKYS